MVAGNIYNSLYNILPNAHTKYSNESHSTLQMEKLGWGEVGYLF